MAKAIIPLLTIGGLGFIGWQIWKLLQEDKEQESRIIIGYKVENPERADSIASDVQVITGGQAFWRAATTDEKNEIRKYWGFNTQTENQFNSLRTLPEALDFLKSQQLNYDFTDPQVIRQRITIVYGRGQD
jgi:hypothetical protein